MPIKWIAKEYDRQYLVVQLLFKSGQWATFHANELEMVKDNNTLSYLSWDAKGLGVFPAHVDLRAIEGIFINLGPLLEKPK